MVYILLSIIYAVYSIANIYNISNALILVITAIIFFLIFRKLRANRMKSSISLILLMGATIPISFRNVLGGEFSANPITWFYVFGGMYFLITILSKIKVMGRVRINLIGMLIIVLVGLSFIPLLISNNLSEGIKEYLTYLFFLLILFAAIIDKESLVKTDYRRIINVYILGGLFSSIGIIFQYIMFTVFSISFFRIEFYGLSRKYFSFMFYDMSSATVYLATVAFFILISENLKKTTKVLLMSTVVIGMALSSARAGLASLFLVLILYGITKKGVINKLILVATAILFVSISLNILNSVRGLDSSLSYLTYDAGRFDGYIDGINMFLDSPLFGQGYDMGYQMKQSGLVVPHFAFINMLAQTGIIITLMFLIIIGWLFFLAKKEKYHDLKWVILISLVGSMIIPGFFNSRFFTVIAALVVLRIRKRTPPKVFETINIEG